MAVINPRVGEPGFTIHPDVAGEVARQMNLVAQQFILITGIFNRYVRAMAELAEAFAQLGEILDGGDGDGERAANPQAPTYSADTPGC